MKCDVNESERVRDNFRVNMDKFEEEGCENYKHASKECKIDKLDELAKGKEVFNIRYL